MITIKATILFDEQFWVAVFERTDKEGYAVARKIFGKEPSDMEIYQFVLNNYHELKFGMPKEFQLVIKRMNPKRLQRQVRREMEKMKSITKPSTLAQDYMRQQLEQNKKQKKLVSSAEKAARKERQFSLRQKNKKERHRGH